MGIYKKARYRVIVTKNGKYLSTLWRCQKKSTAFIQFTKFKGENKDIIFPKKYINSIVNKKHGIRPVEFKILVVKNTEPNDKFRVLRDKFGRTYTEKPIGSWTILDEAEYNYEEQFLVYGVGARGKERYTVKDIIKKITVGAYKKDVLKQIIVVYNKLVIYNEDSFDMVLCKNKQDAQRLHHFLYKLSVKNKITGFTFAGTVQKRSKVLNQMYQIIHDRTGWSLKKIRLYSNI